MMKIILIYLAIVIIPLILSGCGPKPWDFPAFH